MLSPNFNNRDNTTQLRFVILHYTGMKDAASAYQRLLNPESKVSAHWLIDENGHTECLVPEDKRAWHAGVSEWQGISDVNSASIGIELVNPGHEFGYCPFPAAQISALCALGKAIKRRYCLPPQAFIGHSDVAPLRKSDPGELFPWQELASHGLGIWPSQTTDDTKTGAAKEADREDCASQFTIKNALNMMAEIGYGWTQEAENNAAITNALLRAFQRHWLNDDISGKLDKKTWSRITAVKKAYQSNN